MSRVNRCQPARPFAAFQDKTYEEEGSKGREGGEESSRTWRPEAGGLLIFIATPSLLLSPSCSMILSWEPGVYIKV